MIHCDFIAAQSGDCIAVDILAMSLQGTSMCVLHQAAKVVMKHHKSSFVCQETQHHIKLRLRFVRIKNKLGQGLLQGCM